jgi:hypothetical protein
MMAQHNHNGFRGFGLQEETPGNHRKSLAQNSKSNSARSAGSIPARGTIPERSFKHFKALRLRFRALSKTWGNTWGIRPPRSFEAEP